MVERLACTHGTSPFPAEATFSFTGSSLPHSRNIYTSGSRVSSPSPKPRSSSVRESISASKLFRDLSPTRTFSALTADENSVNLPELFRQRNGLQALRPISPAVLLVSTSPTEVTEAPRLLQRYRQQYCTACEQECFIFVKGKNARMESRMLLSVLTSLACRFRDNQFGCMALKHSKHVFFLLFCTTRPGFEK